MGSMLYLNEVHSLIERIKGQQDKIVAVSEKMAEAIKNGNWVRLYGSGHSVIPVMDCFPRYGGYVGFYPIMDPRLMWTTVSGPGGAEELIWLERREGYAEVFLRHNYWNPGDVFVVFSHGGQNAAPVEMALAAKQAGLYVVAITSLENHQSRDATHSSGKKIGDIADIVIDNCVSSEDAVVEIEGVVGKVAGTSTLAVVTIIQSLVAETAKSLAEQNYFVKPFASPNVLGISPNHNDQVNIEFRKRVLSTESHHLHQ